MFQNGKFLPNSTTATRRAARAMRERLVWVSQCFNRVEKQDEKTGVVTTYFVPFFSKGRTYRKVA